MQASFPSLRLVGSTGQLLGGTAAALAVAIGSLLPASDAQAVVVYSGPKNLLVPVTTQGLYINVVTGATGTSGTTTTGWDLDPWGTSALRIYGNTGGGIITNLGSSTTVVDNLPLGTNVGPGLGFTFTVSPFDVETTGATTFVLNSTANYVGFSFLNEATGATNYGWMQMSLGSSYIGTDRAVLGWAYENTGGAINVGAVPEPATVSFMLAGLSLMGLALARRRR